MAESTKIRAGHPVFGAACCYLRAANPSLHHVALDTHGYTIVDITPEQVDMQWLRVHNILDPASPVSPGAALTWRKGGGFGQ